MGTKAAAHYQITVGGGKTQEIRLLLTAKSSANPFGQAFEALFSQRIHEADEFYATVIPSVLNADEANVMRQAIAGMLWSEQFYYYDVNPPVHAHSTMFTCRLQQIRHGQGDLEWLERVFHKLLLNFTWWVNRKDRSGNNVFEGGFLGLDNIGVFDRSAPLPAGGYPLSCLASISSLPDTRPQMRTPEQWGQRSGLGHS